MTNISNIVNNTNTFNTMENSQPISSFTSSINSQTTQYTNLIDMDNSALNFSQLPSFSQNHDIQNQKFSQSGLPDFSPISNVNPNNDSVFMGTDSDMIEALNENISQEYMRKRKSTNSPQGGAREKRLAFNSEHSSREFYNVNPQRYLVRNLQQNMIQTPQQDKNKTIIIEPQDDHREAKMFFANETTLTKMIKASPLSKVEIININKNLTKKLLIITIKSEYNIEELLKLKQLGDWNINCRLPMSLSYSKGVIGPLGLQNTEEEIKNELKAKYDNIVTVKRITKGKENKPTVYIMVEFSTTELPDVLHAFYQQFKVKIYIGKPWQCYNCQDLGHNANECNGKTRCVVCAGNHRLSDCPSKKGEQVTIKCANCNQNHAASYGGCTKIKTAKLVEKVRAEEKTSYREALKIINNNNISVRNSTNSQTSYSAALKNSTRPNQQILPYNNTQTLKTMKNQGTQTNVNYEELTNNITENIIKKVSMLIFKLFSMQSGVSFDDETIANITRETLGYATANNSKTSSVSPQNIIETVTENQSNNSIWSEQGKSNSSDTNIKDYSLKKNTKSQTNSTVSTEGTSQTLNTGHSTNTFDSHPKQTRQIRSNNAKTYNAKANNTKGKK